MDAEEDLAAVAQEESALVVRFLTDSLLDPLEVEKISAQLHAALEADAGGTMIVAMDAVSQLSTLMLSVLISLQDKAQAKGGELILAAVPDRVDYVLELTQLDKAFPTYPTVEEALAAVT